MAYDWISGYDVWRCGTCVGRSVKARVYGGWAKSFGDEGVKMTKCVCMCMLAQVEYMIVVMCLCMYVF